MKTFIVLFIIAASLPADAQRVRENIRQRTDLAGIAQPVEGSTVKAQAPKSNPSNNSSAMRKR
jgi:hypothetical protein